jgi:glycosyltransferase involved in cell wall biosynthesis
MIFIHNHFPGPFRPLAQKFAESEGAAVLFLSERCDKSLRLPGVRRLRLPLPPPSGDGDRAVSRAADFARRAAHTADALLRLRRDGFVPAVIYTSVAGGHGFYAKDIFPGAILASRAEWFYHLEESRVTLSGGKQRLAPAFAESQVNNMFQYNALLRSDVAVASSPWQKEQYPPLLRPKIQVIHDGVDSRFFSPMPGQRFVQPDLDLSGVTELVTFSRRRAGPSQSLAVFAASLPHILSSRPKCHALIMTEDKAEAEKLLAGAAEPDLLRRAHVVPFGSSLAYRCLLRASTVHVYLTPPFSLSAGLFEAMSCGALLVGADTPPVGEVIRHGINGFLADARDAEALGKTAAEILARSDRFAGIREQARRTVTREYDLEIQVARHRELLLRALREKEPGVPPDRAASQKGNALKE